MASTSEDTPIESTSPLTPIDGVTELPDGSAIIEGIDDETTDKESGFGENLAETLSDFELNTIAGDLVELIEKDKEARKKRDEQQEEGIRRTGLGSDAPGGATFDGASKVVHPVLAEGCVDFSARAIKELFPANGPVKTKIYGKSDSDKLEKARNKRDFLNWYTTRKMQEYRSEKEILLTQLPLGGSQYEKYWYDGDRIRMEFVPIDKVYLPFAANSFYTASRVTHERDMTENAVRDAVDNGFFKDVFGITDQDVEESASQKANNKVEGKTGTGYNEDGLRAIYEVTCDWDVEEDGDFKPYVIHIDASTEKIAAIYRNWREEDESCERLDWWVEDKFIPWRGAYGIGFPHLIGGLAASLTGALRALLDSAHINNFPSAIKLKGSRASGQNVTLDATSVTEIEAPAGVDDVRKIMMQVPFNPPSPVLFQLLDWLTAQAKGVVATAEERIADAGSNMPVGTTLALIEQGSMTFSSIHARLHDSQRRALGIICRLIADYPEHITEDLARFELTAEDFAENDDVEPVSDPNIFSESQRYAQLQETLKVTGLFPDLKWEKSQLARRALELLRIDDIDSILPKEDETVSGNPIVENAAAMRSVNLKIEHDQDHAFHALMHLEFLLSPFGGNNPLAAPAGLAEILGHVQEHVNAFYVNETQKLVQQAMQQGMDEEQATMQAQQSAAKFMALPPQQPAQPGQPPAPPLQPQSMGQQITLFMGQAMQLVQSKQPKPPMPPEVTASLQIAEMESKRKAQMDQSTMQMKQAEMQAAATVQAAKNQADQQKLQFEQWLAQMKGQSEQQIAAQKLQYEQQREAMQQQTELAKNEADNRQHQQTEVQKNHEDNMTAIQMKFMELQGQVQSMQEAPQPEAPDFSPMMQEMQSMLSQIEKAKTNEALQTTMDGLRGVMQHIAAPTEVVRGPDGNAIGMR